MNDSIIDRGTLRNGFFSLRRPTKLLRAGIDNSDLSDHIPIGLKTKDIGTLEAKTRLSEILSEVERGRRFYITRHGKRVAELSPINQHRSKPQFGCGKGVFAYVAPDFDQPLDDFREFME